MVAGDGGHSWPRVEKGMRVPEARESTVGFRKNQTASWSVGIKS